MGGSAGGSDAGRGFDQDAVAGVVSKGVVDFFESVEIDEEHGVLLAVGDGFFGPGLEVAAVVEIGQSVMYSFVLDLGETALPIRLLKSTDQPNPKNYYSHQNSSNTPLGS